MVSSDTEGFALKYIEGGVDMAKMSVDEGKFVLFLRNIAKKRENPDYLYFSDFEYEQFSGYNLLLKDMIRKGYLEWKGDVSDGIVLTQFALSTLESQMKKQ